MNDLARDVQTACVWEATARKAGNVHRFADFENLTYLDFLLSAVAIGPVLSANRNEPLGITIRAAIAATREVVATNTNLGIVLLVAPLSKCRPGDWDGQLEALLAKSTVADAHHVYEAIRLATPGGLGKVEAQDVATAPTQTLGQVMSLAADRDLIARQYANGFDDVLRIGVPILLDGWKQFQSVEAAILHTQLHFLKTIPDSLIVRKRGPAVAAEVMERARDIDLAVELGRTRYNELDRWLREDGHNRNPGTTADLVTACLFVALREHRMEHTLPFTWNCYG